MSDYTRSKKGSGTFPTKAVDAASFKRLSHVITPEEVRMQFLAGLPLISPLTNVPITNDQIKYWINEAMNEIEQDSQIDIMPVQRRHRLPFNRTDFESFIYTEVPNKPILSVEKMSITTASGDDIYTIPKEWIDNANFVRGRINVIPIVSTFAPNATIPTSSSGVGTGPFILATYLRNYIPSYFEVVCTHGFSADGRVPVVINRLVGLSTAMKIITNLVTAYQLSSHSLGIDSVSQSQTNQAPQLMMQVYDKYEKEYEDRVEKLKMFYSNRIFVGTL